MAKMAVKLACVAGEIPFVPRHLLQEDRVIGSLPGGQVIQRRAGLAPQQGEQTAQRFLIPRLERQFGGKADSDHIDHLLGFPGETAMRAGCL